MNANGIVAGTTVSRLPEGASATATPVLRPVPGGGGRLFVGLLGSGALPAWILPGAARPARAWALVPGPEGAVLLGGDSLTATPPEGAEPVRVPQMPAPRIPLASRNEAPEVMPPPLPESRGGFHVALAGGAIDLPFEALDRLLPRPPLHPLPEPPPGVRGMAWTAAGPVLVIDPALLGATPSAGAAEEEPLLAVLLSAGRRIGLPCRAVTPVASAPDLPPALRSPVLLGVAPLALPPAAVAQVPTRLLLLARAGAALFAMPLEEVAAILLPQAPRNRGRGPVAGIAAHRGDVLPVLDPGLRLGEGPVLSDATPVPMLRLQGAVPAALAVTAVLGLRAVPEADLVPTTGQGMVAAVARMEGTVIPVLRARALLAPLHDGGGQAA